MSNNKQSSVRWVVEELEKFELGESEFFSKTAIINHADRMHKDEIEKSHFEGANRLSQGKNVKGEQYYNEHYGE